MLGNQMTLVVKLLITFVLYVHVFMCMIKEIIIHMYNTHTFLDIFIYFNIYILYIYIYIYIYIIYYIPT